MSGETGQVESGWSVDTLHQHFQRQLDDMRDMLNERYATQVKAVDAAFLAQQTAMQTALTAAERAVQTALLSAEKAVGKAEVATEKRFESVNEFRAQLSDQTNGFLPREVADAAFADLRSQVAALQGRLDRSEGGTMERRESRHGMDRTAALWLSAAAIVVAIVLSAQPFG